MVSCSGQTACPQRLFQCLDLLAQRGLVNVHELVDLGETADLGQRNRIL